MRLFRNLRERRLAQFATVYAGGGWLLLQITDQLIQNGLLPAVVYPLVLVLFSAAFPGVVIVAWFHGDAGRQRMPAVERGLLAGVALLALVAGALVVTRSSDGPGVETDFAAALPPTEDPRRLAILYFDARGRADDLAILAAGLTESLIDELSAVEPLSVVSRNGARRYRDADLPIDSIARLLEVGTVIEGAVAESDGMIRLSVSVVEGSSGEQVDAYRIERPRAELFALQDELAAEAAEALRVRLGTQIRRAERRVGTDDVEAWELVHRAEESRQRAVALAVGGELEVASRQLDEADSLLARAERRDPDWVVPVVRRGWLSYLRSRLGGLDRSHVVRIEEGLAHAERALAMAPLDGEALELRGTLRYWRYLLNLTDEPGGAAGIFERAEADLERSVAENPGGASAWASLSHLRMNKGDVGGAKVAALRSWEVDPYLENANLTLWRLFSASADMGDAVEARRWCDEGTRRFPEDYRFAECALVRASLESPDGTPTPVEQLWRLHDRYVERSPPALASFTEGKGRMLVAMALASRGMADSARSTARSARAGPEIDPVHELAYLEAIVHTWLGDADEAFRHLGRYLAANPGAIESLANDDTWWLQDLRTLPRYRTLVAARP